MLAWPDREQALRLARHSTAMLIGSFKAQKSGAVKLTIYKRLSRPRNAR
jgi:hypothetical protein